MKNFAGNNKGQFVIEAVLLMVVGLSIFIAATNNLRESKFLAKLIERPWGQVAGMLECGVWGPREKACQQLPGQSSRSLSLDPRK